MKVTRSILLGCSLATAFLCGCVTTPVREGATVSAYSVGDRGRVIFDEVVVSLRLVGDAPYQNLHVALVAFVNPLKPTSSSPNDAEQILRRLETRVIARVSESMSDLGGQEQTLDIRQLRKKILNEGQTVINETMRQWEHGSDYRVELAIASLYWTDASVGRIQQQKTGWWW